MKRLLSSRKLWGALLGSISIMILVLITTEANLGTVVTVTGGLWGAAIGGQAVSDSIKKRNDVNS